MIQDSCKSFFLYLALALGFKNIYDRQDLAFDEEGNSHSKGFDFGEKFSGEENIDKLKVTAYEAKGSFNHITWNDYRIKLEYLFACKNKKQSFTMLLKVEQGLISLKNFL